MGYLRRLPIDQKNYLLWQIRILKKYSSVSEYVLNERLGWKKPLMAAEKILFQNKRDYKIIRNDWPFALPPNITHLVIWSKISVDVDPETGDPSERAKEAIENFLDRTFGNDPAFDRRGNILWFKQKTEWQSVKSLEHIHVMVRDVSEDHLEKITGQKKEQISSLMARELTEAS
jgi:hypothetical protein